jgi:ankyrin repeat protein
LLDKGSNPNIRNSETGFTPLHWAARYGEEAIVEMLIDKGALEYVPDVHGYLPMDYAAKFNHNQIVVKLILKTWQGAKSVL